MATEYEKVLRWCRENCYSGESLFVKKLIKGGLTYKQILVVLDAVDTTCHYCWDDEIGCQCWNDEYEDVMKFTILKNKEKFVECKNKFDLYEKWDAIYKGLAKSGNHDWSTGFMMKSRTGDRYSAVIASSGNRYNLYDRDEYNHMKNNMKNFKNDK